MSVKGSDKIAFRRNDGLEGRLSIDQIRQMTIPEFDALRTKLLHVRNQVYFDTAVFEAGQIGQDDKAQLFRKGYGEDEVVANNPAVQYKKTRAHTNMLRGGEFEQGSVQIVRAIECPFTPTNDAKTLGTDGLITNPAFAAEADYNPAILAQMWLDQVELKFKRGEQEMHKGLLKHFPSRFGLSGAFGASPGGYVQNSRFSDDWNVLDAPQIIIGGEDFSFELEPQCTMDTTAVNQKIVQRVDLICIKVQVLYG